MRFVAVSMLLGTVALGACSSNSGTEGSGPADDAGGSGSSSGSRGGSTSGSVSSGGSSSGSVSSGGSSSGGGSTSGSSGSADAGSSGSSSSGGDASATDASGIDAASLFPPGSAPVDKTAISGLPATTWQFVPVQGAICRDGSPTGIAVNVSPNSKKLMVFLQGGGACFDPTTCANTPLHASMSDVNSMMASSGSNGVFSRSDAKNPMAAWSFVFVPFCTGDVHAGDNVNVTVPGVSGTQQFVGYLNMARYLARLVPTFPQLDQVLLTGVSAGGFGAALNYAQTARAFGSVPVDMLDDSGPPMEAPYLSKCQSAEQTKLWGFEKTILAECGADCPDHSNFGIDATIHVLKEYPHIPFGLMDSAGDGTISYFFGLGANNCTMAATLSPATFQAGLLDLRMKLATYSNYGSFIFPGTDHTTLGNGCGGLSNSACIDGRTAGASAGGGVVAADWINALVNQGTVTNVGP